MGQEPGHSEVVNSLLDLQARLRGDPSDTLSVTEEEIEITISPAALTAAPDLQEPTSPTPEPAGFWNAAPALLIPAPPVAGTPAGSEVPAPPVLQDPDLEAQPSPPASQTREERIAALARRIDHLEQELTFVAEELWRLASEPPPPTARSF